MGSVDFVRYIYSSPWDMEVCVYIHMYWYTCILIYVYIHIDIFLGLKLALRHQSQRSLESIESENEMQLVRWPAARCWRPRCWRLYYHLLGESFSLKQAREPLFVLPESICRPHAVIPASWQHLLLTSFLHEQCEAAHYCDVECQRSDFEHHKKE